MPVSHCPDYCNFVTKLYVNLVSLSSLILTSLSLKNFLCSQLLQNSSEELSTSLSPQPFLLKDISVSLLLPALHQNTLFKVANDFHVAKSSGKTAVLLHLSALTVDHYLILRKLFSCGFQST